MTQTTIQLEYHLNHLHLEGQKLALAYSSLGRTTQNILERELGDRYVSFTSEGTEGRLVVKGDGVIEEREVKHILGELLDIRVVVTERVEGRTAVYGSKKESEEALVA